LSQFHACQSTPIEIYPSRDQYLTVNQEGRREVLPRAVHPPGRRERTRRGVVKFGAGEGIAVVILSTRDQN
jgi:hypothetical protein